MDDKKEYDYLIVGAGFSGITIAEKLASTKKKCLLIDKRDHIGGNCYDYVNKAGVLVHKYGPHYFRAKSEEVVKYLSKFTEWIPHKYKVKIRIQDKTYSFPINKTTLEQFFNKELKTEQEVKELLDDKRDKTIINPQNAEEQVLSKTGKEIYEAFFKGYTQKQWGISPRDLDAEVTARIPIRFTANDDYIVEGFQAMPKEGYTKMFEKMVENPLISLKLNQPFNDSIKNKAKKIIWTGPIDEYYNKKHGELPYRSLEFIFVNLLNTEYAQEDAQINYPSLDVPYTRIVEAKHVTHQKTKNTTLSIEIPRPEGDPFYPMPTKKAKEISEKYQNDAKQEKNIYFLGRLGRYKYLNMDQCVEEAIQLFEEIKDE
jgi:UDP-galactopyranose mutase